MLQKVLVGTDTSASADLAVQSAAELAEAHGAELLILYVRSQDGGYDAVDPGKSPDPESYLARMRERFPAVTITRSWSENGDPADRLCKVAAEERVDAIVVGNKGVRSSRWRVRESVPTMVVRHAPCSVIIVDTRKAQ